MQLIKSHKYKHTNSAGHLNSATCILVEESEEGNTHVELGSLLGWPH